MDDILPVEHVEVEGTNGDNEEVVDTIGANIRKSDKRDKPPRRDNWQYQQQQRSRYSR